MKNSFTRFAVRRRLTMALTLAGFWTALCDGSSAWAAHGDANNDGLITLADAVYVSQYLYAKGPAPMPTFDSGDANCDSRVDPLDAVAIVNYVMRGGKRPGCPSE